MTRTSRGPVLWPELWVGLGLVAFRLATCPAERMWKDWLLILGLFGAGRALFAPTSSPSAIAPSLMAYFLAIHIAGQLPHVIAVLGLSAP